MKEFLKRYGLWVLFAAAVLSVVLAVLSVFSTTSSPLANLAQTVTSPFRAAYTAVHGWLADKRSGGHIAVVAGSLLLGAGGLALLAVPGALALVLGTVLGFGLGWAWPGLLQFAVVRLNPREKRVLVILPVLLGLITGERVLRMAQKRGKGV